MFKLGSVTNSLNYALVWPMVAYVAIMFGLALYNFVTRLNAVKSGQLDPMYLKALKGEAPHHVVNVGRHYDNQFQLPMLFFIGSLAHMVVGNTNKFTVFLAWAFIAARLAHSFVHLGSNKILPRAGAFALGWLFIVLMWGQLAWFAAN